ncbi:pilus assembly protein TadG-related protein [Devosia chinhatensis]|uniref:Flp pilus-assembly TadG-like N-terminal domain-containing protein n=1 Tax=Devosia chinhatensis TaxID=429727 RepID=A0A0F5FH64_9HYPH|nr:pilus assembly protein TadG-related protein [Devosia chinhatensis]KKB07930.1 hypothetical protein VE26_15055 [Devosia chinhatensis]
MIWQRFLRDERGNMAILFAFAFMLSAFVSALAVDAASLYQERRQIQAGVDLAAISAAAHPPRAAEIARSVLVEARLLAPASTDGLIVRVGRYDPALPLGQRFRADALPLNAVEVTLERTGNLHFAAGFSAPPLMSATGLATVTPQVSFSIGSRLVSLNGGLGNAVLSALLGTSVSLSAMDYQALAAARIDAFSFLDALALDMGVTAGSYADLLAMEANTGAVARALATLSNGAARTALTALATHGPGRRLSLGKLVALGPLARREIGATGSNGLGIGFSALDVLSGAAALANGANQVSLFLGAGVPGLARLDLALRIGEPPQGGSWFAVGAQGKVLRTAQTRLRFRAELLGGPVLGGAAVSVPLWLDLAHSEAMLVSATCPGPTAPRGSATLAVRPGLVRLGLGEMSDAALSTFGTVPSSSSARLIDVLLLLRVNASGRIDMAQSQPIALTFTSADIAANAVKTARTTTLAASLFGSLFSSLKIEPTILGIRLGLGSEGAIVEALRALLMPLAPVLDLTVNGVLATLGLGLGEADIRVHAVRCDNPVLVG